MGKDGFRTGGRFSLHQPPASFGRQDTTWGPAHRFVEYRAHGFSARVGNFYALLGRGLVLRSYDSRTLRWVPNIDGVIDGVWNDNQMVEKNCQYTVKSEIVPDSCHAVVMVYKEGLPLAANAEILQAVELDLYSPRAKIQAAGPSSAIINQNGTGQFTAWLYNTGIEADTFDVRLYYSGPPEWDYAFMHDNATYNRDAVATLHIESQDSTRLEVLLGPNTVAGYGRVDVGYQSVSDPRVGGSTSFSVVTDAGVPFLVLDEDTKSRSDTMITNSLDGFYQKNWGLVHRSALWEENVDLNVFDVVLFSSGTTGPAFFPGKIENLSAFLDNGGRLILNGQDMARDVFENDGASTFARDFYKDKLSIGYNGDKSRFQLLSGVNGDPIGDGLVLILNTYYPKSPDKIVPAGPAAFSVLTYMRGPDIAAVRTETDTYRTFVMGIGLEQIKKQANRDTLLARIAGWLPRTQPGGGESFAMHVDSTRFSGRPGAFFDRYAHIRNTTDRPLKLRLVRSRNRIPDGWFSSLCVGELCFPSTLDTIDIFDFSGDIPPGDTLDFHLQVGTHAENEGSGSVTVKIQDAENPADTASVTFHFSTLESAVDCGPVARPGGFYLHQNYPNPFNATTKILYRISGNGRQYVSLQIFNETGRLIRTLLDFIQSNGEYKAVWDGRDQSGEMVAGGIYIYRLTIGNEHTTRKLVYIR